LLAFLVLLINLFLNKDVNLFLHYLLQITHSASDTLLRFLLDLGSIIDVRDKQGLVDIELVDFEVPFREQR